MKLIVIFCDACGTLGGAHPRSAERARDTLEGWESGNLDLCPGCVTEKGERIVKAGKSIRDLARVVRMRESGATFATIGDDLGFTRQHAQHLWKTWDDASDRKEGSKA